MAFIAKHWRGDLPLATSFWLVFVLLTTVYHYAEPFVQRPFADRPLWFTGISLAYLVAFRLVVFPWQMVGLLRSSDQHHRVHEQAGIRYTVQATIVVSLALTIAHVIGVAQSLVAYREKVAFEASRARQDYLLAVSDDGRFVMLNGSLDFGVTGAVRQLVEDNPRLEGAILNSNGGQIYEGRGLARLFDSEGLATYTFGRCSSACSTAFIGGARRYLGPNAQLGFHQYKLDSPKIAQFHRFYDLEKEQQKDLAIFQMQDIDDSFLRRMFQAPHDQIWFPDTATLLQAGVIDSVVDAPPRTGER